MTFEVNNSHIMNTGAINSNGQIFKAANACPVENTPLLKMGKGFNEPVKIKSADELTAARLAFGLNKLDKVFALLSDESSETPEIARANPETWERMSGYMAYNPFLA